MLNLFGEGHPAFICVLSCKLEPLRFLKGEKCQQGKQPLESLGDEIAPHFPLIKASSGPKKMSEDLIPLREFCLGNCRVSAGHCLSAALAGYKIPEKYGLFSGAE